METLHQFPGAPGLFVCCVFSAALSTLSSGFNALAAVTWDDVLSKTPLSKLSEFKVWEEDGEYDRLSWWNLKKKFFKDKNHQQSNSRNLWSVEHWHGIFCWFNWISTESCNLTCWRTNGTTIRNLFIGYHLSNCHRNRKS